MEGDVVKVAEESNAVESDSQFEEVMNDDWLQHDEDNQYLIDASNASIFDEAFHSFPEFLGVSSSSSSCSPARQAPNSSSASSSPSRGALMQQYEQKNQCHEQINIDEMDILENLGLDDLIECDNVLDRSTISNPENLSKFQQEQVNLQEIQHHHPPENDELASFFLEWLKMNKESISLEDLRRIRLKRTTIECAAKLLGGGKEGTKRLLQLILEWIQRHRLQKKSAKTKFEFLYGSSSPAQCRSINTPTLPPRTRFSQPSWIGATVATQSQPATQPWWIQQPRYPWQHASVTQIPPSQDLQNRKFYHFDGDELASSAIATKEARKKRMARQRRLFTHQHRGRTSADQISYDIQSQSSSSSLVPERASVQVQNYRHTDRRQGEKPEKNLRFLLQKVLKQSDVGSLGRIVLPKKEAEIHLPYLDSRDGIPIAIEDIGNSCVWNMRYRFRFWPNNKSRMYLLENTGDFIRSNGLQEGDFIVIYSDVKSVDTRSEGSSAGHEIGFEEIVEGAEDRSASNRHWPCSYYCTPLGSFSFYSIVFVDRPAALRPRRDLEEEGTRQCCMLGVGV